MLKLFKDKQMKKNNFWLLLIYGNTIYDNHKNIIDNSTIEN